MTLFGDLAETIAHLWPENSTDEYEEHYSPILFVKLQNTSELETPKFLADALHFYLPKRTALCIYQIGLQLLYARWHFRTPLQSCARGVVLKDINDIEEIWRSLRAAYETTFLTKTENKTPNLKRP